MSDPIRIEVTAAHIKRGRRLDCWDCPIAHALNSALGPSHWADTHFAGKPGVSHYRHDGADFVFNLDAGVPVKPFTLTLYPIGASEPKEPSDG